MSHYARDPQNSTRRAAADVTWLRLMAAAALAAGLYGRFVGLGHWPLGVDEFYISRSIDNLLRTGLPAFPCGGYYTRGLLYQYTVAGLRLLGWSPEFAGRLIAALSSLGVLPAAFLLGKRVRDPLAGWLVVIMLCLSVWEIEMARFARMYAPFQALFAWYLLAYVRFTVDRHAAALRWMIGLSVLGILLWEGGVLLGVANLFALFTVNLGRCPVARDWRRWVLLSGLLVLLYFATKDLRGFAEVPGDVGDADQVHTPLQIINLGISTMLRHWARTAAFLVPLVLALRACRWMNAHRDRGLMVAGLVIVLAAAAAHAFVAAGGILMLLLLMRIADWQTLSTRGARDFWLALAAFAVYWLIATDVKATLLFGFPDVFDHMLRPWLRAVPVLSIGLLAAFAYLCGKSIAAGRDSADPVTALLSLTILLVLTVGASPTDRIETRYTFFLYPLLIVFAVHAVLQIVQALSWLSRLPVLITTCIPLLCFALSGDFKPRHLALVDSSAVNFRVGMPQHQSEHYYPRNDIRGVAEWLDTNVRPGDVVIAGIPSLDQYYRHIDYFFLEVDDPRYETYVCRDGHTERWTNLPVLYTVEALKPLIEAKHRVLANVYSAAERKLRDYAQAAGWTVTRVWIADSGTANVLLITGAGT
jgi:hypothetical protein